MALANYNFLLPAQKQYIIPNMINSGNAVCSLDFYYMYIISKY